MYFNKPTSNWSNIKLIASEDGNGAMTKISKCTIGKAKNLAAYVGKYYNDGYGQVIVTKDNDQLVLTIGPRKIKWELTPCQVNIFNAYWSSGSEDLVMIPDDKVQVKFIVGWDNKINEMQVDYLNGDGSGIFIKER